MFGDRPAVAGLELATFIDVERNLAGRYRHIANAAFDTQAARRQIEILAYGRAAQGNRLDRGRQAEADMHDVIARRQHQRWRSGFFFADKLERTARIGLGGIDAPGQTAGNRLRILAEARRQRERDLTRGHHGHR